MYQDKPVFLFATDQHGIDSAVHFTAETWPVALAQFIKFMRGAGYYIEPDKILINLEAGYATAEEYASDYE